MQYGRTSKVMNSPAEVLNIKASLLEEFHTRSKREMCSLLFASQLADI